MSDMESLQRLHLRNEDDDLYELVQYAKMNGKLQVTKKKAVSRALGVKPFTTDTEEAFLKNLTHALENIWLLDNRFQIQQKVEISTIFPANLSPDGLFYSQQFDFVVYEQQMQKQVAVLAIELDKKEHLDEELLRQRDRQRTELGKKIDLQMIRVEHSYARRYNHIKEILINFFSAKH